tara:strand:+ start:5683 stop:6939 length:1257 start_codon:yes stop_codon:yes gene_type:complete
MAVPLSTIPRNLSPAMQEAVLAARKEVAEGPRNLARRGVREGLAGRTGGYPKLNLSMDRPSYGWVPDPAIMELRKNTYDAKTLPYAQHGVGIANYGWNRNNIDRYVKLGRDRKKAGDKSGGMAEIYDDMLVWANKYKPKSGLANYLKTGKVGKGYDADDLLRAADYGLRETARQQQTKGNFLKDMVLGNLGTIAGAAMLATPLAPYAVAAGTIGQGVQSGTGFLRPRQEAGLGAGLRGALQGYTVTSAAAGGLNQAGYQVPAQRVPFGGELPSALQPYGTDPVMAGPPRNRTVLQKTMDYMKKYGIPYSAALHLVRSGEEAKLGAMPTSERLALEGKAPSPQFDGDNPMAEPFDIPDIWSNRGVAGGAAISDDIPNVNNNLYYNQLAHQLAFGGRGPRRKNPFLTPVVHAPPLVFPTA